MTPISLSTLAAAFRGVGATLVVPSIIGLATFGIHEIRRRLASPPSETGFGEKPDGILMILKAISAVVGVVGRLGDAVDQIVFNVLGAFSTLGLALGLLFWFIGSGLQVQAPWARVAGFCLLIPALLVAAAVTLSSTGWMRLLMVLVFAAGSLSLHALWTARLSPAP